MKLLRRNFLCMTASAIALPTLPNLASAFDYPTRPVHVVVGFPAGTTVDIIARLVCEPLSQRLGERFIVDDRPGAASNIATETVVTATPDGIRCSSPSHRMRSTLPSTKSYVSTSSAISPRSAGSAPIRLCWWCPPRCRSKPLSSLSRTLRPTPANSIWQRRELGPRLTSLANC